MIKYGSISYGYNDAFAVRHANIGGLGDYVTLWYLNFSALFSVDSFEDFFVLGIHNHPTITFGYISAILLLDLDRFKSALLVVDRFTLAIIFNFAFLFDGVFAFFFNLFFVLGVANLLIRSLAFSVIPSKKKLKSI